MPLPELRPAVGADAAALGALFHCEARFHSELAGYYRLDPAFDWEARVDGVLASLLRQVIVAADGGTLVGFVHMQMRRHAAPPSDPTGLLWFRRRAGTARPVPLLPFAWGVIEGLWVSESHRRQGLGRGLVAAGTAWARSQGAERVELGVLADNDAAIALWKKLGFETFRLQMHAPCR